MTARFWKKSIFCLGRRTNSITDLPYVSQSVAAVKPINARAVQRGHRPMIRAKGPRNSAATSTPATSAGYGSPLAAREAEKDEKVISLLNPEGRNRAAM